MAQFRQRKAAEAVNVPAAQFVQALAPAAE